MIIDALVRKVFARSDYAAAFLGIFAILTSLLVWPAPSYASVIAYQFGKQINAASGYEKHHLCESPQGMEGEQRRRSCTPQEDGAADYYLCTQNGWQLVEEGCVWTGDSGMSPNLWGTVFDIAINETAGTLVVAGKALNETSFIGPLAGCPQGENVMSCTSRKMDQVMFSAGCLPSEAIERCISRRAAQHGGDVDQDGDVDADDGVKAYMLVFGDVLDGLEAIGYRRTSDLVRRWCHESGENYSELGCAFFLVFVPLEVVGDIIAVPFGGGFRTTMSAIYGDTLDVANNAIVTERGQLRSILGCDTSETDQACAQRVAYSEVGEALDLMQREHIGGAINLVRQETGQSQLAICPKTIRAGLDRCSRSHEIPEGVEGEKHTERFSPAKNYIRYLCGSDGAWREESSSCSNSSDAMALGLLLSPLDVLGSSVYATHVLNTAAGMKVGAANDALQCQPTETTAACAARVALGVAGQAVATADAAVRQQLQCQPGETTDACAVRVVNQTALGAYSTVHGTATGAAGCYPGESDAGCAQRRAAEAQAALLTLINGVKDAARNQARTTLGCQPWETDDQCAVRVGNEKTVFVTDTLITTANQALAIIAGAEQLAEATVRNALGCQAEESNEACVVRVANKAIADPVGTAVRLINDLIFQLGLASTYRDARSEVAPVDAVIRQWE